MLFNSPAFAAFLVVVFAAYWLVGARRPRAQSALMLVANYYFYSRWDWRFLALIAFLSAVNFLAGRAIAATADQRRRRAALIWALAASLGVLGAFKYLNFLIGSFAALLSALGLEAELPVLKIILPMGISFYTLQMLTYPISIYFQRLEPTRRVVEFFAFASFFPLIIAGPIERAGNLLPQFLEGRKCDPLQMRDGLRQILNGLLKKVVIADNLAPLVQEIFADPSAHSGAGLLAGAVLFAFQVYCDFSGYSDIAIGVARLFGISLMQNFRFPFISRDIGEFWRRWHISLSTWLRDYVFFPLGAGYGSRPRQMFNVMATFLVSGLWHGADWTFVAWGAVNGLYFLPLIMEWRIITYKRDVAAGRWFPEPREALAMFVTFAAVVLGFVVFRAESLEQAANYWAGVFTRAWSTIDLVPLLPALAMCAGLWMVEWLQRKRAHALDIVRLPLAVRWSLYVAGILALLLFGNFGSRDFIYSQF